MVLKISVGHRRKYFWNQFKLTGKCKKGKNLGTIKKKKNKPDTCVLRIWSYNLRIQPLCNLLSHAVVSLKPWCCQGFPSWAQEEGGTALAWGHLCASWGLALLCCNNMMLCGDDKEAESYLSVHWHKRANILFLLWKCSNMEDCLLEVWPLHWSVLDLLLQDSWKLGSHKTSAAETHAVALLCATTCMLWREAIKCMFSFPGAEAPVHSSAWQCWPHWSKPVGGKQDLWPPPDFCLQVVSVQALSYLCL